MVVLFCEYQWFRKIKPLFLQSNLKGGVSKIMIIINVKENESIDRALKRFKKKFERTGVLKELRARKAYEKPSVANRAQKIKAAYKEKMYANENY